MVGPVFTADGPTGRQLPTTGVEVDLRLENGPLLEQLCMQRRTDGSVLNSSVQLSPHLGGRTCLGDCCQQLDESGFGTFLQDERSHIVLVDPGTTWGL